jgi:hypothetical protein
MKNYLGVCDEMKLDLILNYINIKFFVKMIETGHFKNPNNWSQGQIEGSIYKKN